MPRIEQPGSWAAGVTTEFDLVKCKPLLVCRNREKTELEPLQDRPRSAFVDVAAQKGLDTLHQYASQHCNQSIDDKQTIAKAIRSVGRVHEPLVHVAEAANYAVYSKRLRYQI
jgi:hypothetical protein